MADVVGLTLVKKFTYRGNANEEFSNTYYLSGSLPADAAAWRTLFDALVTQEKTLYASTVSVIRGYGYSSDAIDAAAVWSVDLRVSPETPVAGTLSMSGAIPPAGDQAAWVRWKTSRTNSNGKSIYLRKYFHGGAADSTGGDAIKASYITALAAFGTKMRDGSFAGARTVRSRTHAETIISSGTSSYWTTRTLKRRGKRPGS